MSVATFSKSLKAVATPPLVDSPEQAIELVFEQVDVNHVASGFELNRSTVLRHLKTLRRGFGCVDTALPVQFVAIEAQVLNDKQFHISASKFVDVLWDFWQLFGVDDVVDVLQDFSKTFGSEEVAA